jgi:two-component system sensor histidine kinase PilS (NtrC family)
MDTAVRYSSLFAGAERASDSLWTSLRYFSLYRIAVAALFLGLTLVYGDALSLGSHRLELFRLVAGAYLVVGIALQALVRNLRLYFSQQLTLQVAVDVLAITLLMYASGGIRSGLGVMLMISLAGAALVSRGTLMLFYAAIASIAVLLEQSYWVLVFDFNTANFVQPGLLSIGYFATALITNQLAQRLITKERVARQRGTDLANQLRINQLVLQDVQDGVMVVDANGLVRQHNPQVAAILGRPAPELGQIEEYSADLERHLAVNRVGLDDPDVQEATFFRHDGKPAV